MRAERVCDSSLLCILAIQMRLADACVHATSDVDASVRAVFEVLPSARHAQEVAGMPCRTGRLDAVAASCKRLKPSTSCARRTHPTP